MTFNESVFMNGIQGGGTAGTWPVFLGSKRGGFAREKLATTLFKSDDAHVFPSQ